MTYSTTNVYRMKREIITFSKKISSRLPRTEQKFFADMLYGMLGSGSCLLSEIAHVLHEDSRKINVVDRLSRHLAKGVQEKALLDYLRLIQSRVPEQPTVYLDDSDVVKPEGQHFEALGIVRDGSASTEKKNVYEKGYHVTEACAMTASYQPLSFFSEIHSSREKDFTSINTVTFSAIDRAIAMFKRCTFSMDRGYDDNKIFLKLLNEKQDFVIRIRKNRKLYYQNRWFSAAELCARRKGKVKMRLRYRGEEHDAYLSHVKVRLTAAKREVFLVLVYGITENPMMLVTNKPICSKGDVMDVARTYFSRWRIEEYFRAKKQVFDFENFRVRSLAAINALNFFISTAMTFLTEMQRQQKHGLLAVILDAANPIKRKVHFFHYRILLGIRSILSHAKTGVKDLFKTICPDRNQLRLRLIC